MPKLTITGPEGATVVIQGRGVYPIRRIDAPGDFILVQGLPEGQSGALSAGHSSVSRNHLEVQVGEDVTLIDHSKFGSFLNGERFSSVKLPAPGEYKLKLANLNCKLVYE